MPIEQHPASFIESTKDSSQAQLYEIVVKHPKTGRHEVGGMIGKPDTSKAMQRKFAQAHWPAWTIVSVRAAKDEAELKETRRQFTEKEGPGVPLDELTDGAPNAIMANANLADPDYDPDKDS